MSNELRISDITGLTYTCEVRETDGTLLSTESLMESGSTGRYYGDFPSGTATDDTTYDLIYVESSIARATQTVYWNGSKLLGVEDTVTATGFSTLNTADIDARLTAYGLPTLTQLTAAFTEIKGAGWTITDTLEAIRDNLGGGGASVDEIVEGILAQVATISLVSPLANDAGHISIPIGTTVEFTLTQAFSASWEYVEMVFKDRIDIAVPDSESTIKAIVYENGDDGGLVVLNGSPVAAGNTSVVITPDQPNNSTAFKITDTITKQLEKKPKGYVAFRWVDSNSDSIAATASYSASFIAAAGGDTE